MKRALFSFLLLAVVGCGRTDTPSGQEKTGNAGTGAPAPASQTPTTSTPPAAPGTPLPSTPTTVTPLPGPTTGPTGNPGTGGAAGGGTTTACTKDDCRNLPVTDVACADGRTPNYTCARADSGACRWSAACPPTDAGTTSVPGAPAAGCRTNDDCRLFDDYCMGCDCRALTRSERDPTCSGPGVRCLRQPCLDATAVCEQGACTVKRL
jgi:hypothetical protein